MRRPPLRLLLKCLVVAFILAAAITFGIRHFGPSEPSYARSESASGEEKSQAEELAVSLRARTRQVKSAAVIRLQWDPSAKAIRRSSFGILYIYDGGVPRKQVLERKALDAGSTEYKPASDEITFHLRLPGGRPEGESLLVLLGSARGQAALESDADRATANRPLVSAKQ